MALVSCAAWVHFVLDAQYWNAQPTGSRGYSVEMDRLLSIVALVNGVIGGLVASVGWFLKPRRATLSRSPWATRGAVGGVALLALGISLFVREGFVVGCLGMCGGVASCTCSFDISGLTLLITAAEVAVAGIAVVVAGVVLARPAARG